MKRLHVHVGVTDLHQSIRFYSTLFAATPTVIKDDYAKWMLDDPRVNFAISSGAHAGKGITLYLPRSKGDRENLGQTYQAPALLKLCPVQAYIDTSYHEEASRRR